MERNALKGNLAMGRLSQIWKEKHPEAAKLLEADSETLMAASDEDLVHWGVGLFKQLGAAEGTRALVWEMWGTPLYSRIVGSELLERITALCPTDGMPQTGESEPTPSHAEENHAVGKEVRGPSPAKREAADPEPASVHEKQSKMAAQIKKLEQRVKRDKDEIQALKRQLQAVCDREASLTDELAELRAKRLVYQAAVEETEPRARVHRLTQALFEALRENEELKQKVVLLQGMVPEEGQE